MKAFQPATALAGAFVLLAAHCADAAGFQWATAPDPGHDDLTVAIWYPSNDPTDTVDFGPIGMDVAQNGSVVGQGLPLVILSHGTGGSELNSYDTAIALADAGFVVAALRHTGDNYKDDHIAFTRGNFANRPLQVSRVIDFMLNRWSGRRTLDAARIGFIGHSAGGMTGLLTIGAKVEWERVVGFCAAHADDWGCAQAKARGAPPPADVAAGTITGADGRIKAAVLAAPAVTEGLPPDGLAAVHVPVQLWIAAEDTYAPRAAQVSQLLPTPPDLHVVPQAGHFAFLAPCSDALARMAPAICTDGPGFDRAAFLQQFHADTIGFFRRAFAKN